MNYIEKEIKELEHLAADPAISFCEWQDLQNAIQELKGEKNTMITMESLKNDIIAICDEYLANMVELNDILPLDLEDYDVAVMDLYDFAYNKIIDSRDSKIDALLNNNIEEKHNCGCCHGSCDEEDEDVCYCGDCRNDI